MKSGLSAGTVRRTRARNEYLKRAICLSTIVATRSTKCRATRPSPPLDVVVTVLRRIAPYLKQSQPRIVDLPLRPRSVATVRSWSSPSSGRKLNVARKNTIDRAYRNSLKGSILLAPYFSARPRSFRDARLPTLGVRTPAVMA